MRSRTSQARALFRILSAQNASGSSATASASTASATTSSASTATVTHSTAFKKRTNTSHTIETASTRLDRHNHRIICIPSATSQSTLPAQSVITGLQPAHPPPASFPSVATQAFFANGRPLLEHQVVSSSKGSSMQMVASQDGTESLSAKDKSFIDSTRDAIMEAASQASRLSPEELSRTTFVVKLGESDQEGAWPKKVVRLDHDRFVKLVDRLSQSQTGLYAVQAEAKALEAEQAQRKDIDSAVASALERGEDPSVAKSLGSEADLVILGEPSGPNPEWPRGVASFLVDKTRALEPPKAATDKGHEDVVAALEQMDLEDLAKHFGQSAVTVQNVSEDHANLLLNHAMVQAILPSALKWDAVVAKMEAATSVDKTASTQTVDWSIVNAGWESADNDGNDVHMDSVKRKRRKKMRKHKYRKFRKATRTERNRLKKG